MTRTILDFHILQTVPPSCLNRDDTGSPKTAVYGGVRRARVSSQAWKRATRTAFQDLLDPRELGVRTRRVTEALGARIRETDPMVPEDESWRLAEAVLKAAIGGKLNVPKRKGDSGDAKDTASQSEYLIFLSTRQLQGLAELALKGRDDIDAFLKAKDNQALVRDIANSRHSVDIALFGRMVADAADINVDAAVQVAHAISVHAVDIESDYFTAVDDHNSDSEPGAGMIATVDFDSATLYRYAAVDVDRLQANLGAGLRAGEPDATPVRRAVEAFVEGFLLSMPTGKLNTFANHTLPDAVLIKLRDARPISFVGAFETAVPSSPDGHVEPASKALARHVAEVEAAYGAAASHSWLLRVGEATAPLDGLGTPVTLRELIEGVGAAVAGRLEQRG